MHRAIFAVTVLSLGVSALAAEPTSPPVAPPATQPAVEPTTQPAFVPTWMADLDAARAEAKKTDAPLLVVWTDPASPASRALELRTLKSPAIVPMLKGFVLVAVDASTEDGKVALEKAGLTTAPVTQLFAPDGELLTAAGGAPGPLRLGPMIEATRDYVAATGAAKGDSPAVRLAKVRARLQLSTRAKAIGDIRFLLKLPAEKLPKDTSPAKLQLALGAATAGGDNTVAAGAFGKARKLAGDDEATAAAALLGLAGVKAATGDSQGATEMLGEYITTYPTAADLGKAVLRKASIEFAALNNIAAAQATLETFLKGHPDHAAAFEVRQLLTMLTNPVARPAGEDDF